MECIDSDSTSNVIKHYLIRSDYTLYDYTSWKTDYGKWLKCEDNSVNPYHDPDTSCYQYYKDLSLYLNAKERTRKTPSYTYEPWGLPLGIRVKKGDDTLFYLYSDQLGFSPMKKVMIRHMKYICRRTKMKMKRKARYYIGYIIREHWGEVFYGLMRWILKAISEEKCLMQIEGTIKMTEQI
ncbi:MAG: hypothetical protein K6E62_08405 [Lachnospiraceae bacterium]|nr:hypothetical protein [Lachnospiraceae bacterium]